MDILQFLDSSPSPAWAAESAAQQLKAAGFSEILNGNNITTGKVFVRPHAGMVFAAVVPGKISADKAKFRIIGAHTDSPHLRLKPNTLTESNGYAMLTSEIYGGVLLYTWFDRELGIAGEIYFKEGAGISRKLVKISDGVAIVPSLAIHLQRGINEDGFAPPKATSLNALISIHGADFHFNDYLATNAKISPESLLSYDLSLFDTRKAARGGVNGELMHSARLDNLVSCFAAIEALKKASAEDTIQVIALFDHEEIGSLAEGGAESALSETFLRSTAVAAGLDEKAFSAVLDRSVFLSADMAHAVHPNFADKHDSQNRPKLGGGVTLKINQNRRYATSAATQAIFHDICRTHKIASQVYTHRNDLPCGGTIGPFISARLGIATLDIGVAMLGMHSIRETCAWGDVETYVKFMAEFLAA